MFKLTFLGAGSTIFAKNVCGDILISKELKGYEIALYDIDEVRLNDSYVMLKAIQNYHQSDATIKRYLNRKEALKGADFIVNAIQVGGYEPSTVIDFEIPKKYGLRQTIGDTLGIGGIFRALRTIHVLEDIAKDIHEVCPNALFLNYTNPMAILTGYLENHLNIRTIGLCHSVQVCVPFLLKTLNMQEYEDGVQWKIAGINHQAWLLEVKDKNGVDLYHEIKKRSLSGKYDRDWDLVRHDLMHKLGFYITESSEHTSEYVPWYIKSNYPKLIEQFKIPLDEYPRRCIKQISEWKELRTSLTTKNHLEHHLSNEYALPIIKAIKLNQAITIHGNITNHGYITNLPEEACVEVPCIIDKDGIKPNFNEPLPLICRSVNMTNINVQLLVMAGARKRDRQMIYQAAFMDPHTAAELSLQDIQNMCDELFEAHKAYLPNYEVKQ
ncbi:alpha-glucosidase/alpha-galactosidase [Paracholeplasma manati]|uniref:alpha-glucosidase/alpha-galactosidase n=1 Tax=Paracholeplasma manati TaxID=591373 RepID=UPI002407C37E|nr:alpha-glucosidase/alpha-galactosidase [Paracholeplasma manati]MDG0888984.1 alpha-glucosidase/alpha-galactosidase [Paracholeplasma manati]